MKKKIIGIIFTAVFIFMLCGPSVILNGARLGISLWLESVVPSLLPYMILSNFIIYAGISGEAAFMMKPAARMLGLPDDAAYCIMAGLLFGYPACAVTTISMYNENRLDKNSVSFLTCAFNNISPAFIAGYVCVGILNDSALIIPVLVLFYIIILLSTIIIKILFFRKKTADFHPGAKPQKTSGNIFDRAITGSLINIAKLAGYIITFSVVASVIMTVPCRATPVLCSVMEVTTGINALAHSIKNMRTLLLLIIPSIAFGGISGIFQTFGVDSANVINRKKYIFSKLVTMAVAFVCTYLFEIILNI